MAIFSILESGRSKNKIRTSNYILRETKLAREWRGFPQQAIVIAENGCGDYLIFLPERDNPNVLAEPIYLWRHETGDVKKIVDIFQDLL